jgi:hypothetical protein
MREYICACVRACVRVCVRVCSHVCMGGGWQGILVTITHLCVSLSVCLCMHVRARVCVCVCGGGGGYVCAHRRSMPLTGVCVRARLQTGA